MGRSDVFHLGSKVLIQDPADQLLLLKVNLEELSGYAGEAYWDIPGGRVHRGDSVLDTLWREVLEETGISEVGEVSKVDAVLSNIRIPVDGGDVGLVLFVYRYICKMRPAVILSDEHVEYAWMSKEDAAIALSVKYPEEFTAVLKRM